MSETPTSSVVTAGSWFRPGIFLGSLLIGLLLLAWLGRQAGRQNSHPGFVRIHPAISPEGNYHPTVDELGAIVRARCRPDQVLVIVGGNSIFNGVGQPVDKKWTREFQRLLGDGYAVINLALRGGNSLDGGAVIAEVLRKEFPRQIYVANTAPLVPPTPVGQKAYQYLFWEAYYRGLLETYAPRSKWVQSYQADDRRRYEIGGEVWLDRVLKYRDFWNWIGYEYFFTVPSFYTPRWPDGFTARRHLKDGEPDFEQMEFLSPERFAPEKTPAEMAIVRGFSQQSYTSEDNGGWRLKPGTRDYFIRAARTAMPDDLRPRTLIMLSRNSPYYRQMLSPVESLRDDLAYRDGVSVWQEAGYAAAEYGRDFAPEDFGDRTHLAGSGGGKLAGIVAQEVLRLAGKLGYAGEENQ